MDVVFHAVRSVLLVRVRPTPLHRLDLLQHAFEVRVDDEWRSFLVLEILELQPFIPRGRQFDATLVQTLAVHGMLGQLFGQVEVTQTSTTITIALIMEHKNN